MMMAWKYTIPAFIVPFMFVLTPDGIGLLLEGSPFNMVWTFVTAMMGIVGIAGGASTWLLRRTALWERAALIIGGLLLVYSNIAYDFVGMGLVGLVVTWQRITLKRAAAVQSS